MDGQEIATHLVACTPWNPCVWKKKKIEMSILLILFLDARIVWSFPALITLAKIYWVTEGGCAASYKLWKRASGCARSERMTQPSRQRWHPQKAIIGKVYTRAKLPQGAKTICCFPSGKHTNLLVVGTSSLKANIPAASNGMGIMSEYKQQTPAWWRYWRRIGKTASQKLPLYCHKSKKHKRE